MSSARAPDAVEAELERLLATCPCDACERYRQWFIARAAIWAVRIEQVLTAEQRRLDDTEHVG